MMLYWCVNCGEPGVCTHKTKICGYCGWDGISEWDEPEWLVVCKRRQASPKPHPPKEKVAEFKQEPIILGVLDL